MMEYSDEYIENWNYSHYNVVENYRNFTARFATAIFTTHYEEDNVIFKDEELLIVSEYEKINYLYEEFMVMSKKSMLSFCKT